jgi:Na+/proline symporter
LSAVIAIISTDTLYNIVFYAWSGQGSTFGPLVLFVLYVKKIPAWGAVSAMICGAFIAAVWPYTSYWFHETPMIPGFFFSSLVLFLSLFFRDKPA